MRRYALVACFAGLCLALFALGGVSFAAEGFAIRINDLSGLEEEWPLVCGLPFPEGALRDASRVRLLRDGAEIAAQIDVTATWPDGSVRWALAGFTGALGAEYRVEFGPGVTRSAPQNPLRVEQGADGAITVDTGAAVYEFLSDRLLPESARMGGTAILSGSGDGAYLVDNHGRMSRVAGPRADVETQLLKQGPARVVVRREGWYVTPGGERVARARAWFYFAAGSPFVRVTHSLVLTEDTNALWVRDYGLEFRTPSAPEHAAFALGDVGEEELVSVSPDGGEVYLLQDTYPHFLEREHRALVGRDAGAASETLRETDVAGDWADASYGGYGLTVATPFLAQRFPKELAFGPRGARVVLWSGRSGRELDFRAKTLVEEYWQSWSERAPGGASALAEHPSNAQAAARTHDVWLMPRLGNMDEAAIRARGRAASRRPLALADPEWACATDAIGWPVHPVDEERFPREETMISEFWERLMSGYQNMPMNGFIAWGCNPYIRGSQFFRLSRLVDYGMRTHVWGLYARSGERRYYEYGTRFNQFAGDWEMAHVNAGDKFRGGFAIGSPYNTIHLPFYWGDSSQVLRNDISGHDIKNWLIEHYMTGDEHPIELTRMFGEAMRERWDAEAVLRGPSPFMILRVVTSLYTREWDAEFRRMAGELAERLIDLDNKVGLTDDMPHGALYKMDRNALALYDYHRATGDPSAREAFLRTVDYKYRFHLVPAPISYQNANAILFTIAYRWTGNPAYPRIVKHLVDAGLEARGGGGGPHVNMHPTLGMPAARGLLAELDAAIEPYPVLEWQTIPGESAIVFRKANGGEPLRMTALVTLADDTDVEAVVTSFAPDGAGRRVQGITLEAEGAFQTSSAGRWNPRARHCQLTLPAETPSGLYVVEFPGAERVLVQESTAEQIGLCAPRGLRLRGEGVPYFFRVGEDVETLRFVMSRPMELRRPDGSVAVEESNRNIGEMETPVNGQHGIWSVRGWGVGFFRLLNGEPVFSQSLGKWLPAGAATQPAQRFEPEPADMEFVAGPTGRALYLPGERTLRFPRGDKRETGYAHFPSEEGTIEFWFRPNWSSTDLPVTSGNMRHFDFLRAGSHRAQYQHGERGWYADGAFASLSLWTQGQDGGSPGFKGWKFFKAGEWHHVAITWRLTEGARGTEGRFNAFVNGEALAPISTSSPTFPSQLTGRSAFRLQDVDEQIVVGPFDGAMAQLRISDIVRYEDDFEPPKGPLAADANTRVFFPLDGNYRGTTGTGGRVMLEE